MMENLSKIKIEDTLFALSLNYPSTQVARIIVSTFSKEEVLANLILSETRDVRGYLLEACWVLAAGYLKVDVRDVSLRLTSRSDALFTWGAILLKASKNSSDKALAEKLYSEASRLKVLALSQNFRLEHQRPDSISIILKGFDKDFEDFGIYTIAADIDLVKHHAVVHVHNS
ncbi:MAG: hypothetical protein NTX25_01415 [Proteobacteria bacterium]|nr:hypothetical protein [Pseudomonadota bacterium]